MKLLLSIFSILLLSYSALISQNFCSTPQDNAFMQRLIKNKANWDRTQSKGSNSRLVPVTFHLVARNDGTGRLSEDLVYNAICTINERLASFESEIRLFLDEIRLIENNTIYSNPQDVSLGSFKDFSSVNVFCVGEIASGSGGTTLGYYQPGVDIIVMKNDNVSNGGWTFEHEVGHYFSLAHTHRGWESTPYDPNIFPEKVTSVTVTSSQVSGSVQVELMNGSNCGIAGDMICDTPPDYGRGQSCNCCVLNTTILDRNCEPIAPIMNNVMSYSNGCADWLFTPQQILAMETDYDSPQRAIIRGSGITSYTPILAEVEPLFPINLETAEVYDHIDFSWKGVPNAEFYKVYIGDEVYETNFTRLLIEDLSPNSLVQWRVNAFNRFGSGCVAVQSQAFWTGDTGFSAVSDLEFVESINIYPNPLKRSDQLSITFSSSQGFSGSIKLVDISGKVIYIQNDVNFATGFNSYKLPDLELSGGVYILQIETKKGSIAEKIIVE